MATNKKDKINKRPPAPAPPTLTPEQKAAADREESKIEKYLSVLSYAKIAIMAAFLFLPADRVDRIRAKIRKIAEELLTL